MAMPGILAVFGIPDGSLFFFYTGLLLICVGTGLLKPNISTMVGELYKGDMGARRDAGFSIFYMGINLGAFLAPIACGQVRDWWGWHFGFGLAGVGMTFGVLWYILDGKSLGDAGMDPKSAPEERPQAKRMAYTAAAGLLGLIALLWTLDASGTIALTWTAMADAVGGIILLIVGLFLTAVAVEVAPEESRANGRKWIGIVLGIVLAAMALFSYTRAGSFSVPQLLLDETYGVWAVMTVLGIYLGIAKGGESWAASRKVVVIGILFLFTALFWSGFEQASTSLNAFARDLTDRTIFGWEMTTEFLQAVNPLFIIILAPFFGALWIRLSAKNLNPSIPLKFALGLIQLSLGFFVIMFAAGLASSIPGVETDPGKGASVAWLCLMYLLFTTGELCLSPIGLSTITKLAPPRFVSQMMGIWFIAAALGNLIAGRVGGQIENLPHVDIFRIVAMIVGVSGLVLLLFSPWIRKRLMGDVE
jgi:POT family proton-dependent oligopeptide transporter